MDISTALRTYGADKIKTLIKAGPKIIAAGGLNTMDSPLNIPFGEVIGCLNYEPSIIGGYRRFDGYERFDGQLSPSNAAYISQVVTTLAAFTPAVGDVVTESGSLATGLIAYIDTANLTLVIVPTGGTVFLGNGATLTSGAQTTTAVSTPKVNAGLTIALSNAYYYQKWLMLQARIGTVGGSACSGPVRGVCPYLNRTFAFRDSADGSEGTMWMSDPDDGWQQIDLGIKVRFNAGVYSASMQQPPEGTVLVGATSGATFNIKRLVTQTGTWGTDAAGYFIVFGILGTPVPGELLKVGTTTYMTYLSNEEQTLPPGGQYKFRTFNFNAAENPETGFRMYGVNGVGNGFEYDATTDTFVLIETGVFPDAPDNLEIHAAAFLFYSFPGGSLQNSGYQVPLVWNAVFGADARAVGEDVTFLREDVDGSLIIGTRRRIWMLTGLITEQFQIMPYAANTGAIEFTDELPGQMIFAEDRGFTTVSASQKFGNFEADSLSDKILDIATQNLLNDTAVGAIVIRRKNVYRLHFASGVVMVMAVNAQGDPSGWLTGIYPHPFSCVACGYIEDDSGVMRERVFAGLANGYVIEMEVGRSFDGLAVPHFLKFCYAHLNTPDTYKRFRRAQIDVRPEGSASVFVGADCDYGARSGQTDPVLDITAGGGLWNVAHWDEFIWDAPTYTGITSKLELEGYNISLTLSGTGVNDVPFSVTGINYQYSPRILNRTSGD